MRSRVVSLVIAVGIAAVIATPATAQRVRRSLSETRQESALLDPGKVARLKLALEADHISVATGDMFWPPVFQLACAGILSSCNGNNNANPYMVTSLPPVGYEWDEDPPLGFLLRQDEAVLLIGRTPPPVTYFSYRSFIFSRFVEREGIHRPLFVSLGDPNNMLTIKTRGTAQGDPFDRAFVLLSAADKSVQTRVLAALHQAGYPDEIINLDVISPSIARPGLDPVVNDEYILLQRFALWKPGFEQAGAEYLADPPVTVLRVTPNPAVDPAQYVPLPVEKLRPRGTGRTELDYLPEVEELRRSILAEYADWNADEMSPGVWLEESFQALQHDLDVLGESRDTVYLRSEGTFNLNDDEFLVIYGTNHETTGKATYANFAVYDTCKACPLVGETSRRVAGSALDYVGGNNPKAPHVEQLYAWKVARDCGDDPRCTTFPPVSCPGQDNAGGRFFVGFRAYVEPSTKIGPAFTEVVFDRVIRFSRSGPVISEVKVEPAVVTAAETPAVISFHVASSDGEDVTWTATVIPDHGCAVLEDSTGVISGGNGDIIVTVTPSVAGQRGTTNVRLDATDAKGRRATPRTAATVFRW